MVPPLEQPLDEKYRSALVILRELGNVVVAFSGGVDSTLVLKLAVDALGDDRVIAVTGRSPSVAAVDLEDARELARTLGARHEIIDTSEFENPNYISNPTNRCYFCKTTLYDHLDRWREGDGTITIVNGTNADDLRDHRPGLQAADEHRVRSPLAEARLTKNDVRELSKLLGLPTATKPASPCLSSRVQYGEAITIEKLSMIEQAEAFLHSLGIRECRVRHHDMIARIEVSPEYFAALASSDVALRVDRHFRSLGYAYVTLDLRGFRSGSMNEVIAFGKVQPPL